MNIREDEGSEELILNLTPMIDVIFLLLIFFMVATTFQDPEREMDVDLPAASSGAPVSDDKDELVINIMRDGTIILFEKETTQEQLVRVLNDRAQENPETPVTIRGDRLVHHETVVAVMDACGSAGLQQLSLGTLETN